MLNYVCVWDKNREKSWSGTTFSLYSALNKKTTVKDCSVRYSKMELLITKFSKLSFQKFRITKGNQFPLYLDLLNQKKLTRIIHDKTPTLQIGCFGYTKNSYIYEDLAACALLHMYENNKDSYDSSNFRSCNIKSLRNKSHRQLDVYEKNEAIFTMSNWVAEILRRNLKETKVFAVGAGINIDRNKIDYSQKEKNKFLFVGRDFYRKGGDLVVKAFLELSGRIDGLELYIAGPLEALMDTPSNVYWVGDIDSKQLHYYFNLCDVFCMPSRFEAYGLVFSEALCFGLPCIGRDICEMPYFIEDGKTGRLLEKDDFHELARIMEEVLVGEHYFENVLNNKEYYFKKYSWDAVADRIMGIVNCISDK